MAFLRNEKTKSIRSSGDTKSTNQKKPVKKTSNKKPVKKTSNKNPKTKQQNLPAARKTPSKKRKRKGDLSIPKISLQGIEHQIANSGIPEEILQAHLENLSQGDHYLCKDKSEIGKKMLYCLANGWSIEESATLCGINKTTIFQQWCDPTSQYYDEKFSQIIHLGISLSELWWTSVARANFNNKNKFDSTLWMMNMSNRFGWTRKLDGRIIETIKTITKSGDKTEKQKITHEVILEASEILKRALPPTLQDGGDKTNT